MAFINPLKSVIVLLDPLLASSLIDPNIDSVKQFVASDPRVAAQVIKGWVGGE